MDWQVKNAGTSYNKPFTEWLLEDALPSEERFDMNQTYARNAAALTVVDNFTSNVNYIIDLYIEPMMFLMTCVVWKPFCFDE